MGHSLILAAAEHGEHTEGVLLGLPTYWFAIIAAAIFLTGFFITISFSGRGIVRTGSAGNIDIDEEQALKEYKAKHH